MNKTIVIDALYCLIESERFIIEDINTYFDKSYQQIVDGKSINYQDFVEHIQILHRHTDSMHVEIESIISEQNIVFTHHFVEVKKPHNEISKFEVFAKFTLLNNKITRCQELTRLVSGNNEDKGLGSKVS